jgi:pimeloyl-ACP methyl ester carboxylesterase
MSSAPPLLHHDFVTAPGGTPERWAFMLHGIYGAGRNWNAVCRRVAEVRPEWGFVPVDLRGHGKSPTMDPPHTLAACVADLDTLAAHLPTRPDVVIGHSFGGKVALLYGDDPAHHVSQTWVVDSTPDAGTPGGGPWRILQVLRESPGPFPDRGAGVTAIMDRGFSLPVAQWMSMNLAHRDGAFHWRLDPDQMEALLRDFFRTDAWGTVEGAQGPQVHMIRATESALMDEETSHRVEAAGLTTGRAHLHLVEGGHWLNADNPEAVVRLLADELT